MYIDPIHAGPVALAHVLALSTRQRARPMQPPIDTSPAAPLATRRLAFRPLRRLQRWWRDLDHADSAADPMQLILWSECVGRPHLTALTGVLLINQLRGCRAAKSHEGPQPP